jgi:hypothetical protein
MKRYITSIDFTEATILEVSKSGNVKLKFENGNTMWTRGDEYEWIEELD